MIKVKEKIVIPVPPSEVFSFLCDPARMAELSNHWERDEVTDLPGGLHRTRSQRTTKEGVVVNREGEGIERIPNTRVVTRIRVEPFRGGRAEILTTRTLAPVNDGTLLITKKELRVRPWYRSRFASRSEYHAAQRALHASLQRLRTAIVSASDDQAASVVFEDREDGET